MLPVGTVYGNWSPMAYCRVDELFDKIAMLYLCIRRRCLFYKLLRPMRSLILGWDYQTRCLSASPVVSEIRKTVKVWPGQVTRDDERLLGFGVT